MSERRAGTRGRRMGSSRRKLLRDSAGEAPAAAPSSGEESPWAAEMMQKVQGFLREQDKDQAGFITRSDMEKLQEEGFPCSREEMELIFDGLDAAGTGRLSSEEFTAGLGQFLSSQKTARHHRRSKMGSRRVRLVIPSPALEGADSEERRHFAAFMEQLGTDNVSEEQEIWQLWLKLRQDEPQLLGNLEAFLAKMRHRIQEAKSRKEALELTLNKRVAEHDKEVQQLCEALEQQIQQEQQRLQQESMARSQQHDLELQQALDASEREVQRLVTAQKELEARCHRLHSTQQATSTENQQLEESNRVLEDHLQHLHQQLQETQERLQTARAAVAQGHVEQPRYRVVAELPSKTPLSPQMSLEKSEMFHSETRIRLGSQSTKAKPKSTHHVVWEMPPAEGSFLGAQPRASSTEEDPFPEFLKEEHFSDQSSLLREMNDAIAALNKQLKPQALDAPPVLADAAQKPWKDAEPHMGPEAATGHGTPPRVRQETLSSHIGHEMFEGDLKEGPATAELHAPGVTQAGASRGAGHHRAEELGAEQGETLEEAWGMIFLQGKGSGVKDPMPKAAEHPQGALGESTEAEEQVLLEGEGEGWMQEKAGWEMAQLLGEAKEAALSQGENLEVGLGLPEAGEAGLAAGWQLGLAAAPEEYAQPPRAGLGEEADPPSGLSREHEIHPGEHLEPERPSQGEVRRGASQEDGVPEVTVAPGPGMLKEEHMSVELQPWGETLDADVPPAQQGGSRGAGVGEGEVEVTQPMEAELQPQGESARGDAEQGGSMGAEGLEGGDNQDLGLAEAVGAAAVCAEGPSPGETPVGSPDLGGMFPVEAQALELVGAEDAQEGTQLPGGASPDTPQGQEGPAALQLAELVEFSTGRGGPAPLPVMTFGVQRPGGEVNGDVGHPEEDGELELVQGEGSKEDGLILVKPQGLELAEAEDAWTDRQLPGGASPETPLAGEGPAVLQLVGEAEDGARGQGEHELLHEPVLDPQGQGAPEGMQPWEEAESLAVLGDQSSDANVQETIEADKLKLTLGGGTEAALQPPREAGYLDTEQEGSVTPDLQPLDQLDTPESGEKQEAEDAQEDTQLPGRPGPEALQGRGDHAVLELVEEAEDGARGQGECELLHEPELDPQGQGAPEGMQPWEEAESLAVLGDQSSDANVSLLFEVDELKSILGGGTEADLQPPCEAGYLDTEQGGSLAPDVQPLDQLDAPQSVEQGEAEDSGQGECELLHEPVLNPHGEGASKGVQPWEEAESLAVLGGQSSDANVPPLLEMDDLKSTPVGVTEAALQLWSEQGGSLAPDVQPLDQLDAPESVEQGEAEDAWTDRQLPGGASPETPLAGEGPGVLQLVGEAEDGEEGQGECELLQEPELEPQGEGPGLDVQPWEEAVVQAVLGDQSSDANVSLLLEVDELKSTLGGGTGADLLLPREAGYPHTEQGGGLAPGVQLMEGGDNQDLGLAEAVGAAAVCAEGPSPGETPVGSPDLGGMFPVKAQALELVGAEESQADTQLPGHPSPEAPHGGGDQAATQLKVEDEDGAQGQGEHELLQEPLMVLQGTGLGQGDGSGAEEQPGAEAHEFSTGRGGPAPLPVMTFGVQRPGGEVNGDVGHPEEDGELELVQGEGSKEDGLILVKCQGLELAKAEDAWTDRQLPGGASPETPLAGEGPAALQLVEEAEDGARGQGEHELLHEPVLDPQGQGAPEGMQPWEEAESLAVLGDQSSDANVSLLLEMEELKSTPGGGTEAALQPPCEAGYLDTEQGGSLAPDVQPLDQLDAPESVEQGEAEDAQADRQLPGGASPETPLAGEGPAVLQLVGEAEDGEEGQGECELLQEPELEPQGQGPGLDVQPWEEAESLAVLGDQSSDANVPPLLEMEELKSTPGGGTEAALQLWSEQEGSLTPDVQPLDQLDAPESVEQGEAEDTQADRQLPGGASPETPLAGEGPAVLQLVEEAEDGADLAPLGPAGMQEGEQSQTPGLGGGLHAAHTADVWEGAAGAHVCVSPEATLHPEHAAEGPGVNMMLGALTGADGQIPEDAQTLEIPQGEGNDAEDRPLDGAQALEAVQGGRLEAGERSLVGTQTLGIQHGHGDDGLPVLVSKVPLQISTLQLQRMMQEDVLVPDPWQLGGSGQAAPSELQEQVSAQRDKGKLHTASQQPPHVMEREQGATRPAEPPEQEVPPATTLHTRVQQEEGAESDQLGMVLRNSSLRDAAIISVQPQRQLLGEQSQDLLTGQQEKQQEAGWKMSHEGGHSPGVPGPVSAAGAEAAPRSSPEAFLDPDHLYNVLFVGDSHVGKTSFLYRLHADAFNPHLTATVGLDYQVKNLVVDNKCFSLRLWDSAGQERYRSITRQYFRKADGVVLMYDITSEYSFSDVRYWLTCIQEGAEDGVGILLLGNKTDRAAERRVPTMEGERLAKEHQLMFYECSAASGHNVSESMVSFVRLLKAREDELKNKVAEEPRPPQKKKGCC